MVEVITAQLLADWSRGQVTADDAAERTVAAVNAYIGTLPVSRRITTDEGGQLVVPDHVTLGALLLANRTHRRRHSPNGIEAITGESVAYVARYDPEIARYLELDRPRVG